MKKVFVQSPVKIVIPLIDLNGDPVTVTALSYSVTDEEETQIVASSSLPVTPGMTDAEITIAGSNNVVAGVRLVALEMTTADGPHYAEEFYEIVEKVRLVTLENSFQTYVTAQREAASMSNLVGWATGDVESRIVAMKEAFERLKRIRYRITYPQAVDTQSILMSGDTSVIEPRMWSLMTDELFARYPENFKKALRQAQIAEANEILRGDPIADKRRSGLMSESIGESSMMFRAGMRPIDVGMSPSALSYLSGFIDRTFRLTRV